MNKALITLLGIGVVLFLLQGGAFEGAVVSTSTVELDSGEKFLQANVVVNRPETLFVLRKKPGGYDTSTKKISPQAQFVQVGFTPNETTCSVTMKKWEVFPRTGWVSDAFRLAFGSVVPDYFYFPDNPHKDVKFSITVDKTSLKSGRGSASMVVSGAKLLGSVKPLSFVDPKDEGNDGGTLLIENLGYYQGAYDCGSLSDLMVFKDPKSKRNIFGSKAKMDSIATMIKSSCANIGLSVNLGCAQAFDELNSFIANPSGHPAAGFKGSNYKATGISSGSIFQYDIPAGVSGSNSLLIKADLAFWDSIIVKKQAVALPQIIEVSSIDTTGGKSVGFIVKIRHNGKEARTVNINVFSDQVSVRPKQVSPTIGVNQVFEQSFVFDAPVLPYESNPVFSLRACISTDFVGESCVDRVVVAHVGVEATPTPFCVPGVNCPTATPVVAECGNARCEDGENSGNCPGDCGVIVNCNEIEGSIKTDDQRCICPSKTVERFDEKDGKKKCVKEDDWTWLIGVGVAGALLLGAMFLMKKKGR